MGTKMESIHLDIRSQSVFDTPTRLIGVVTYSQPRCTSMPGLLLADRRCILTELCLMMLSLFIEVSTFIGRLFVLVMAADGSAKVVYGSFDWTMPCNYFKFSHYHVR